MKPPDLFRKACTPFLWGPERQGRALVLDEKTVIHLLHGLISIKDALQQKRVDSIWINVNSGSLGELIVTIRLMIISRDCGRHLFYGLLSTLFSLLTRPRGGRLIFCWSSNWNVTKQGQLSLQGREILNEVTHGIPRYQKVH